jgi:hypothetical protein
MQTPDATPVVQPHAGGPGGHAAEEETAMFKQDNHLNATSSSPETARQSAGAEGRPDRRGGVEDESVITAERGSDVAGQKTVYKFHFNPKSEIVGATAAELADSAEEVAPYLTALATDPQIEAEPDGNQGMLYRTSNRRVAARFNFPEMWTDGAAESQDPAYTDEERRAFHDGGVCPSEYRTWSCRAEYSLDLAEILLRLHNHPKFGALLGYRADKMHGAPMLEITTTLTRDEILDAFASTFDTHVMAQSLRPVPLEENNGERDCDAEVAETHRRLPRPPRFCLVDRFLQEYFLAFDESHRLVTPVGVTTTLRRADSDTVAH